jgi:hypothetical protein
MTTTCWTQRTQLSLAFGPPDAKRLLNWMPVAIAVTVFLVDFLTPRGMAASAFLDPQWTLPRGQRIQEDMQPQRQEFAIRVNGENGNLRRSPLR